MTNTRTLATFVVNGNEQINIIIPFGINQIDLLNGYVNNFCFQRRMGIPLVCAIFQEWSVPIGVGEFKCESCSQTCLKNIDLDDLEPEENFCSLFCKTQAIR